MPSDLMRQLRDPDPVGIDLALFRTRMYRFSDDPRHYALAETLEERYIEGQAISMAMLKYVTANLESIRSNGRPLSFEPGPAAAEQINIDAELRARPPSPSPNR